MSYMRQLLTELTKLGPMVQQALVNRPYDLSVDPKGGCRIATSDVTVRFVYDHRDSEVSASITPIRILGAEHPMLDPADAENLVDAWLRSQGEEWPRRPRGPLRAEQVVFELRLVERALKQVFVDPDRVRDALIFVAGYNSGYTDRYIVEEEAPSPGFIGRLLANLGRQS